MEHLLSQSVFLSAPPSSPTLSAILLTLKTNKLKPNIHTHTHILYIYIWIQANSLTLVNWWSYNPHLTEWDTHRVDQNTVDRNQTVIIKKGITYDLYQDGLLLIFLDVGLVWWIMNSVADSPSPWHSDLWITPHPPVPSTFLHNWSRSLAKRSHNSHNTGQNQMCASNPNKSQQKTALEDKHTRTWT